MNLNTLRDELDLIDLALIHSLKNRHEIVQKIFELKQKLGIKLKDHEREKKIRETYTRSLSNRDPKDVEKLVDLILSLSQAS